MLAKLIALLKINHRFPFNMLALKKIKNSHYFFVYCFIFNILALIATTMVLTLISAAPAAGLNNIPWLYKTPAANGRAITL